MTESTVNQAAVVVGLEVLHERERQDAKWGQQNHPDGTGPHAMPLLSYVTYTHENEEAVSLAADFTARTDRRFHGGERNPYGTERITGTWTDILLEEVFEALAEDDPQALRAELIQVAAVAQSWVEAIDRRTA